MAIRVLIVDDEAIQRKILAAGLRGEGFDVAVAPSALEALTILDRQPVDVALVDLMMPVVNGLDFARQLRTLHPAVGVALMSAYHLSEPQLSRADVDILGFIPKPYVLAEVAAFLRAKIGTPPPSRPRSGL